MQRQSFNDIRRRPQPRKMKGYGWVAMEIGRRYADCTDSICSLPPQMAQKPGEVVRYQRVVLAVSGCNKSGS